MAAFENGPKHDGKLEWHTSLVLSSFGKFRSASDSGGTHCCSRKIPGKCSSVHNWPSRIILEDNSLCRPYKNLVQQLANSSIGFPESTAHLLNAALKHEREQAKHQAATQ